MTEAQLRAEVLYWKQRAEAVLASTRVVREDFEKRCDKLKAENTQLKNEVASLRYMSAALRAAREYQNR